MNCFYFSSALFHCSHVVSSQTLFRQHTKSKLWVRMRKKTTPTQINRSNLSSFLMIRFFFTVQVLDAKIFSDCVHFFLTNFFFVLSTWTDVEAADCWWWEIADWQSDKEIQIFDFCYLFRSKNWNKRHLYLNSFYLHNIIFFSSVFLSVSYWQKKNKLTIRSNNWSEIWTVYISTYN